MSHTTVLWTFVAVVASFPGVGSHVMVIMMPTMKTALLAMEFPPGCVSSWADVSNGICESKRISYDRFVGVHSRAQIIKMLPVWTDAKIKKAGYSLTQDTSQDFFKPSWFIWGIPFYETSPMPSCVLIMQTDLIRKCKRFFLCKVSAIWVLVSEIETISTIFFRHSRQAFLNANCITNRLVRRLIVLPVNYVNRLFQEMQQMRNSFRTRPVYLKFK